MSSQTGRSKLRARALWALYTVVMFCGLLVAPFDAVTGDLPWSWKAVTVAGLIVSLPMSLVWVAIASYDPVEIIPSPTIIIGFLVIGAAVFTIVQVGIAGLAWRIGRRLRKRSTANRDSVASR